MTATALGRRICHGLLILAAAWPGAGYPATPGVGKAPPLAYSEPDDGEGRVRLPDGSVYEGEFHDGRFNGQGVLIGIRGDRYEGGFRDGMFHGSGEYVTENGDAYHGEFRDGALNGEGEIRFANGDRYRGDIRTWRMSGRGRLERHDGTIYEGEFVDGRIEGRGEMRFPSGDRYVGAFSDGRFDGEGVLYRADAKGHKKKLAGTWKDGRYVENRGGAAKKPAGKAAAPEPLDAESVLFYQYPMLAGALGKVRKQRPGRTDLYFVAFGGDAGQDVFMKEALYTRDLFERRFAAEGRTLMLVNNRKTVTEAPLASVTNLRKALRVIAGRMDVEEDILFLYLTSHGSRDHAVAVRLDGLPLHRLSAKALSTVLDESGIKWRVIVISACYSGGFIEELKNDYTLIMTSARHDHSSFGCSDEAEFTYFGRALFERALPEAGTFKEAFAQARDLVTRWEDEQDYDHSEPQLYTTPRIEAKLAEWRAGLEMEVGMKGSGEE